MCPTLVGEFAPGVGIRTFIAIREVWPQIPSSAAVAYAR